MREVNLFAQLPDEILHHLLKTFIDIHNVPLQDAILQISIHFVFLLSALLLAYSDKIMASTKGH